MVFPVIIVKQQFLINSHLLVKEFLLIILAVHVAYFRCTEGKYISEFSISLRISIVQIIVIQAGGDIFTRKMRNDVKQRQPEVGLPNCVLTINDDFA